MTDPRNYSRGVRSALIALCGGTCYWSGCPEPVVRFVDGEPVFNLQIAHIYGALPNGPRYNPGMTEEQRKEFANLILLCQPHHLMVDVLQVDKFDAAGLLGWKAKRETEHQDALNGLREVTPQGLQRLIAEVVKDRDDKIMNVLNRLEASDAEGAELLRGVLRELAELRQSRFLDAGITEEFIQAAGQLYQVFQTGALEEFNLAAENLRRLPDY